MTQKEKNTYLRNEHAAATMEKIISMLKKRDTATNIENLQKELDDLVAKNNPLKKCLSMYKIK